MHVGAAAGLQVVSDDLDQPDVAAADRRFDRHGLDQAGRGFEFRIGDPARAHVGAGRDHRGEFSGDLVLVEAGLGNVEVEPSVGVADRGVLTTATGDTIAIANASYTDPAKTEIAHLPAATTGLNLKIGETVRAAIDWDLRYARMRMHTALHLLSAVLPYPVTGGAVGDADGRLDFDIPEAGLDKDEITRKLAAMIAAGAEVRSRWITDAELEAAPGLVKTMSVKPPIGTGRVRLIEIVGYDLQPCGGTHVHMTSEIGNVRVTQIEKKGKQNRRVRIAFA